MKSHFALHFRVPIKKAVKQFQVKPVELTETKSETEKIAGYSVAKCVKP